MAEEQTPALADESARQKDQDSLREQMADMSDCLPSWQEAGWREKSKIAYYTVLVYLPVCILVGVMVATYPLYVILYIKPMVFDENDRPELYYWHSDSEHLRSRVVGGFCFTLATIFLLLFMCSFYKAFTTHPGSVPETPEWRDLRVAEDLQYHSLVERKHTNGALRWCRRCSLVKPDRSHHCRLCDQCILKMDHHCPWIANCVGFFNYKYFFLMITYGMLSLWLFEGTFWETALITWRDDERGPAASFLITVTYFLLGILMCAVTIFWFFHTNLIAHEFTTIEYCEKLKKVAGPKSQSSYFVSLLEAFKHALGTDPFLWPFPFCYRTEEEKGLYFQKREEAESCGEGDARVS